MSEQREQPEQRRCECGAAYFDDVQWVTRYFIGCAGATNSAGEIIVPVAHCPGECGCRLSVVDGQPRVGLSVRAVIEKLREADRAKSDDDKLYSPPYFHGRHIAYEHAIKLLGGDDSE